MCMPRTYNNVGDTLGRRFEDAVYYLRVQRREHSDFTSTFSDNQIAEWSTMIQAWYDDPSEPDPFEELNQGTRSTTERELSLKLVLFCNLVATIADVRHELAQDEDRELDLGIMPLHEVSLSQFLVNGMELEEAQ